MPAQGKSQLRRNLSYFDVTNMVVGAIVGSDIYVASALTAGMVGPFSIVCWLIAGFLAAILASVFAYSSFYVPRVGGAYAYVTAAFDKFFGFLAGWSMWIAEILSLPVFAIVFTNYLEYFIQLNMLEEIIVKFVFVFGITYINIVGVKRAARVNDTLTIIKLLPLFLMVVGGIYLFVRNPALLGHYSPFFTGHLSDIGPAIVLVFWAYAGFELAPLPATEIKDPTRTLPKAIFTGMAIITLFYLTTNFVVYGMADASELARTMTPLSVVGTAIFGAFGAGMMAIGALFSVSGSDESAVLGTSRLAYAMSVEGLFPKIVSRISPKYKTPYVALIIQAIIAFVLSLFSELKDLISFAVLNLSFSYLLTCLALLSFRKKGRTLPAQNVLPIIGVFICVFLIFYTSWLDKLVGAGLILMGIPMYYFFSHKMHVQEVREALIEERTIFVRKIEKQDNFLAYFLRFIHRLISRI
jgi:basic amino acid/polyamine antiporter, APA family